MILRIENVAFHILWLLFFVFSASALRIPSLYSLHSFNPSLQQPIRFVQAQLSPSEDLPQTELKSEHYADLGSKRVMLRYGPYTIPPSNQSMGMKEFNEMSATKPCVDCYITALRAGLEYPNGSIANSDTGMWLHHAVLYDFGRKDLTCSDLPYRFFASGNERTPLDMTLDGYVKLDEASLSLIELELRRLDFLC
jgi:hypothetical protein